MLESKRGVAALSIASNTSLTILKLVVGLLIGSVSVVAEALHSSIDLLASIIAFFAVSASAKPPDERYPYGRGKVENVSGTVEALLILLAAGLIVYEAIKRLVEGAPPPDVDLGLIAMGISVAMNFGVSRQLFKVARKTDSVALEADAYHLTTDILTSLGVFVGLILVRLTGWAVLDAVAALGVAALIAKTAWDMTKRSFVDLLDRSISEDEQAKIRAVLDEHRDFVASYHRVRTRRSGPYRYVDLHLVVNAKATVYEAHSWSDHLEADLREALPNCSLNIHIEPCRGYCDSCGSKCVTPADADSESSSPPQDE